MATKLKNLKITSVDLVEQGANPDAHIKLYKSKNGQGEETSEKNTLLDRLLQKLALMAADYLKEKEADAEDGGKRSKKTPEGAQVAKAKAELALVEKQIQRAKTMEIAKGYAILGKSADGLCDTLLELRDRSPHGYEALLDVLDEEKLLIAKSGVFSDIGKRGEKGANADGWGKIMQAADRLQKENPALTRAGAIQKACEDYPQLVEDYEENL